MEDLGIDQTLPGGKYGRVLIGYDRDALDNKYPGKFYPGAKTKKGQPSTTHAHHIVMRNGLKSKSNLGRAAVTRSKAILEQFDIDPYTARENLIWAPPLGASGYVCA